MPLQVVLDEAYPGSTGNDIMSSGSHGLPVINSTFAGEEDVSRTYTIVSSGSLGSLGRDSTSARKEEACTCSTRNDIMTSGSASSPGTQSTSAG